MEIPNKRELQQMASNHSCDIDFKDFMKFYKDSVKEPYSFLVNDTTLAADNLIRFRKDLFTKMSISWIKIRIKAINNKMDQNKT